MSRKNRLPLILSVAAGLAFVVIMILLKQPPERQETQTPAVPVRVLELQPLVFRAEARGYGQVLPAESWNAVTNVGGRIVWKNPQLESGNLIPGGTRLLQIDPTRYQLAVASARADLAGIEAELRQLEQEAHNTRALLKLEEDRLTLATRELERARTLSGQGALSQTRLDEQERITLQQQQAVQRLQNQLNLVPSRQQTLEAREARTTAALNQAQEDLDDTRFEAPWDMRVHQADIETGQHVSPGQALFVADNISRAEATVQLQVSELRRVLSQLPDSAPPGPGSETGQPVIDFHQQLPLDQLEVWVSPTNVPDTRWPGMLTRITSSLDPATRTVQAVISVAEPYRNARPPARPPLVRNMFVEASIAAPTPEPVLVLPASAVHEGVVYLADANNRLKRQTVSLAWQQGDVLAIADGLAAGQRVILDDLVPAIEGTVLTPQVDAQARELLQQQATGEQP